MLSILFVLNSLTAGKILDDISLTAIFVGSSLLIGKFYRLLLLSLLLTLWQWLWLPYTILIIN